MLRKLDGSEHLMYILSDAMPIQFAITARIKGDFSISQLRRALVKARRRHPLLAVRVVMDKAEEPWFTQEGVPELPMRVLEGIQDGDWLQAVKDELREPFSMETGPLVRFVLIKLDDLSDLIAICHHSIADGLSAAYLVRDILHYLSDPCANVEPLPLMPPIGGLIPPAVEKGFSQQSAAALTEILPAPPTGKEEMIAASEPKPAGSPHFYVTVESLAETQTTALIVRAHQERTTVHGALGAAFLRAFAEVEGQDEWERTIQSPANLRNQLAKPVGESVGTFITSVKTTVDCSPERDFWQIAREVKEGLAREIVPEKVFTSHAVLNGKIPGAPGFQEMIEMVINSLKSMVAEYDLSLSNLGRLDIPTTYGPLKLQSIYGPTFSAVWDNIVCVNTVGGQLRLTFVFREELMEPSTGEHIKSLAMRRLEEAVGWAS